MPFDCLKMSSSRSTPCRTKCGEIGARACFSFNERADLVDAAIVDRAHSLANERLLRSIARILLKNKSEHDAPRALRHTAAMLARVNAGIETAGLAPLRGGNRSARAPADHTDPHVAEVDKPRFAMGIIFAAAAGERRHAAIEAAPDGACKLSIACVSRCGRHAAAGGCGQWPAGITAAGHRLRYLGLGINRQR